LSSPAPAFYDLAAFVAFALFTAEVIAAVLTCALT
jgi:hypothetical protein